MLAFLYPLGFAVSLFSLILWFYAQENDQRSRVFSQFFLGGFFVYLFALAFSNGDFSAKLFVLFRDLIVLGLVSQFFNFFKKNKVLFFGMLALLYGAFQFYYYDIMINSFKNENTTTSSIEVAKDGELLVEMQTGQNFQNNSIVQKYNLQFRPAFQMQNPNGTDLDNYFVVDIPEPYEDKRNEIIEALETTSAIAYAEENEIVRLDDPKTNNQPPKSKRNFGINDPGIENLWGFDAMEIDKLYELINKSNIQPQHQALIAILDTGVDAKHEDLAANYKSIKSKHDTDPQAHGTHCAGIAAAVSNNGKGVASFSVKNNFVKVSSVRVLNSFGMGTQQSIINGILEAADNKADVISMSLGGPSDALKRRAYNKAIKYANKAGSIVVVAAGNSNKNAKNYAPANTDGVITVSAIDSEIKKAVFSNTVEDIKMGIAAPGVGIYSTVPKNKYATFNGTSMATPYVSGLVGLLKSINPQLTTKEVYEILNDTGIKTKEDQKTGKLIFPMKALGAVMD